METAAARPQLPALALPDIKSKRDEDPYQPRTAGVASLLSTHINSIDASHHHGPPPPYSGPPQLSHPTKIGPDQLTPPGSRRPSGEKELAVVSVQPVKQSLPSISEALGVDNQAAYQTPLASQTVAPPPPVPPLQTPLHKPGLSSSPIPAMRSYAAEPPRPYGPSNTMKYLPADTSHTTYSDVRPALHVSTAQTASPYGQGQAPGIFPHAATTSPSYDPSQQPAPGFTYGYAPYPPRYAQGSTPSGAGPIFQSGAPAPSWTNGGLPRSDDRAFGESVKRQLDMFDLESALNDIASGCTFLSDFASRYGTLLHQSPRSGPPLSLLPSMIEIEDMIAKSRAQTEAIIKIRESVLTQQVAHEQEAAEQRLQPQKTVPYEMQPPHSGGDSDDGKSTFGSDSKKRRGRAAPPGRCHSCNRAETPEWRRGPDGARTLCNACGLHYAKLTRKQNTAGTKSATTTNSSNLRPKEQTL